MPDGPIRLRSSVYTYQNIVGCITTPLTNAESQHYTDITILCSSSTSYYTKLTQYCWTCKSLQASYK